MVRTKNDQDRTMSDVAGVIDQARGSAWELVRREEYRTGSRMIAYHNIGAMVGRSGSWVRKFIGGYGGNGLDYLVGLNINALYGRICERIEVSADLMEETARALNQSNQKIVDGVARAAQGEETP